MNNPIHTGVSPRRSTGDRPSVTLRNITLDIEVREERGINVGAWGSATAEVHRVRAMKTHAEVLGRDMAGILHGSALRKCLTEGYHTIYQ